jgi:hypothetical protein
MLHEIAQILRLSRTFYETHAVAIAVISFALLIVWALWPLRKTYMYGVGTVGVQEMYTAVLERPHLNFRADLRAEVASTFP